MGGPCHVRRHVHAVNGGAVTHAVTWTMADIADDSLRSGPLVDEHVILLSHILGSSVPRATLLELLNRTDGGANVEEATNIYYDDAAAAPPPPAVPAAARKRKSSKPTADAPGAAAGVKLSAATGTGAPAKRRAKPLHRVRIVISGIQNPERAALRADALGLGATYSADWKPGCTHCIAAFEDAPKCVAARASGGLVVRTGWLATCKDNQEKSDEESFFFPSFVSAPTRPSPPPATVDDEVDDRSTDAENSDETVDLEGELDDFELELISAPSPAATDGGSVSGGGGGSVKRARRSTPTPPPPFVPDAVGDAVPLCGRRNFAPVKPATFRVDANSVFGAAGGGSAFAGGGGFGGGGGSGPSFGGGSPGGSAFGGGADAAGKSTARDDRGGSSSGGGSSGRDGRGGRAGRGGRGGSRAPAPGPPHKANRPNAPKARAVAAPAAAALPTDVEEWTCTHCTFCENKLGVSQSADILS